MPGGNDPHRERDWEQEQEGCPISLKHLNMIGPHDFVGKKSNYIKPTILKYQRIYVKE